MSNKKLSYADAVAEVEQIVANLRSGELGVDELSRSVARATQLIEMCRKQLAVTEEEVEKLVSGNVE